jgi:sulfur carrier protein ThiS
MKIKISMMGMLKEYEPENNEFEAIEGMTVDELLHTLEIADKATVFFVNDTLRINRETVLQENDEVTFIGPVGGG